MNRKCTGKYDAAIFEVFDTCLASRSLLVPRPGTAAILVEALGPAKLQLVMLYLSILKYLNMGLLNSDI